MKIIVIIIIITIIIPTKGAGPWVPGAHSAAAGAKKGTLSSMAALPDAT